MKIKWYEFIVPVIKITICIGIIALLLCAGIELIRLGYLFLF